MTAQIAPEFLRAFHFLEAAFPAWKPKPSADGIPGTLDAYWAGLSDLPMQDVARSMAMAVHSCEFAPSVAKIRDAALGYKRERERAEADQRERAQRAIEDREWSGKPKPSLTALFHAALGRRAT